MAGSVAALAPPVETVLFNGATMDLVVFSTTSQSQHSYREVERYYPELPHAVLGGGRAGAGVGRARLPHAALHA